MKRTFLILTAISLLSFVSGCISDSKTPTGAETSLVEKPLTSREKHPEGYKLFMSNCARCHNPNLEKGLTGPGLYKLSERAPNREWSRKFIRNSEELIKSGDAYAIKVYNESGKAIMDPFPNLTDAEIDSMLVFIDDYAPRTTN